MRSFDHKRIRIIVFILAALLHLVLILSIRFKMEESRQEQQREAAPIRLVDLEEARPPPPPEPPRVQEEEVQPLIAQDFIPTDEPPPPAVTGPPLPQGPGEEEALVYLPMHMITLSPVLPHDQIIRATVYPRLARESRREGLVIMELFIDPQGLIRDIQVLRENPEGWGFAEAALQALRGIRAQPAQSEGVPVAVRLRYNFNFQL
ncbi:MAG: energy transducer TonB [Treponema sp.]|nr:energy transducer TonB [Treponema sp.]